MVTQQRSNQEQMKFYAILLLVLSAAIFLSYLSPSTTGEYAQERETPEMNDEEIVDLLLSNVNAEEKKKILKTVRKAKEKGPWETITKKIEGLKKQDVLE